MKAMGLSRCQRQLLGELGDAYCANRIDGASCIYRDYGDHKVYINDCGKRGFKRLQELYAVNDHIGFMLGERVGIRLTVPDAVKGLKVV